MNRRRLNHGFVLTVIALLLFACGVPVATQTPQPPGTIIGNVKYTDLTNGKSTEPIPDVMIALCRVPAEGLPEGPTVAASNRGETEHICILQGEPTGLTRADGVFTLNGVPQVPTWFCSTCIPPRQKHWGAHGTTSL